MGFKKDKKYIATAIVSLMVAGQVVNISFADSNEMVNSSTNASIKNSSLRGVNHGDPVNFSVDGTSYSANAEAHKDGNSYYTVAGLTSSKNVAKGKMAVSASVYDGNGVLLHSTAFKYNDTSTRSLYTRTVKSFSAASGKRYIASGYARVINSKGNYIDKKLPSKSSPKSLMIQKQDEERTILYEENKMIPALALNNKEGYVLENDLLGEVPKSPEEALAIQESSNQDDFRMIPVYDKDGKTIIGEFRIDA